MGILPGSGPLWSGPTGPGSGFSVMPSKSSNLRGCFRASAGFHPRQGRDPPATIQARFLR